MWGKDPEVKSLPTPPACPLHGELCPLAAEVLRLQDECRRLLELSRTDSLTGLFNWRHLVSELDREMERTRRSGLPTGLIMFDLDHFKRVNDSFGHHFGDAMLRWVCHIVRDNVRRLDIPCRYGGEEFAIVLPGISLPRALKLAERLRRAISQAVLKLDGQAVSVTASFGVDVYLAQETLSSAAFLKRADQYLLEAKAQGRNLIWHRDRPAPRASTAVTPDERRQILPRMNAYEPQDASQLSAVQAVPEQR